MGRRASWLCVRPALRLRAARVFERGPPRRRDGKGEDEGRPSSTAEYWYARVRWPTAGACWQVKRTSAALVRARRLTQQTTVEVLLFFRFSAATKCQNDGSRIPFGFRKCFSSVRKWHQAAAAMTLVQPSSIISAASIRLTFVGVGRFSLPLLSRSLSSKRSFSSSFAKEEWRWWGRPRRSSSEPFAKHWVCSRYTSSPFHRTNSASTT